MRVIAGTAGGIPLKIPKTALRPTMDLVRGAVFSSLGGAIVGAKVLDLFAGTGSFGIEALSRGAVSATMVEIDRKACAIIAENLDRVRLEAHVVCNDVFRFLALRGASSQADFIFADPPYSKRPGDRDYSRELVQNPDLPLMLVEGGIFVLEVAQRWILPEDTQWTCLRRKRYGSTETLFLTRRSEVGHLAEGGAA
jgi:16S rRNA (guanine966-N2)-methyltransferase